MDAARRKQKLAILRSYAERHFCNAMPMHVVNAWRSILLAMFAFAFWIALKEVPDAGWSRFLGVFVFMLLGFTFYSLFMGLGQVSHPPTSWAGKFIKKLHDYAPVDGDAYGDFCKVLLANGMQKDAVKRWLAHEEAAMESDKKAHDEHVRALASELPAGDLGVVSELEAYVASLDGEGDVSSTTAPRARPDVL